MKKILPFLIILFVGCSVTNPLSSVETFSKEWYVQFNAALDASFPLENTQGTVLMNNVGEFSYTIFGDNTVKGKGEAKVDIKIEGDISQTVHCSGSSNIPVKFNVEGTYDPITRMVSYVFKEVNPFVTPVILKCPSASKEDLVYQLPIPLAFYNEENITLEQKEGNEVTQTINHSVPSWDIIIPVPWTFKIIQSPEFTFDVDINPNFVTIKKGETAQIPLTVKSLKGSPSEVKLTATAWDSSLHIEGNFTEPVITPTQTTVLNVNTTCDTPLDNYLYTVRAETSDSFYTSIDSVSIVVQDSENCYTQ